MFACIIGFVDCRMFNEAKQKTQEDNSWMHFKHSIYQRDMVFSVPLVMILGLFMLAYYVVLSDMYKEVHERFTEREVVDRIAQER